MAVNPIQLQKYLKGVNYPVNKKDLIKQAEQNGADQKVLETLKQLPDQKFEGPSGVSKAIGDIDNKK
ncbi:MAG TPA: DUF2795 domain-containing protein [Ktedonobacteraceae bacterium]|jgi:hypothetical protein|nr:DUF2795 domain-containing protein [Ktedonobacteraceae bacterium]